MNPRIVTLSLVSGLALAVAPTWAQNNSPTTHPVIRLGQGAAATRPALPSATLPAPGEPAFTLNGKKFTEGDLQDALSQMLGGNRARMDDTQFARILENSRRQVIDAMVRDELLRQEAEKHKITVTDKDVDQHLEKMVQQVLKDRSISREQLDQEMKQRANIGLDEQIKKLKENPNLRKRLLQDKLGREMFKDAEVSGEEIQQQYEQSRKYAAQVRASHILIRANEDEPKEKREAARKKAEEVLAEVKKPGADFAELAKKYSDCPSKSRGGDLSFFPRHNAMVEPFAAAAFALKPGEISDVVETVYGYHIIKTTETRPAKDLEEVREEVKETLKTGKIQTEMQRHLQELVTQAKIEYPPGKEPATQPAMSPAMMQRPAPPSGAGRSTATRPR